MKLEHTGIPMQTMLSGGVGHYILNNNTASVSLLGGIGWARTRYDQSGIHQPIEDIGAAVVAGEVSLFKFKKTNLHLTANAFPATLRRLE